MATTPSPAALMINPTEVCIGHGYATDQYVILDLNALPPATAERFPETPGWYTLSRTKPAVPVHFGYPDIAAQVGQHLPDPDAPWAPCSWSSWTNGDHAIGALAGEPIAVNAPWLRRLPDGWRLEGIAPNKPLRIVRPGPAYSPDIVVGVVNPVKLDAARGAYSLNPVHRAIAAELCR